MKSCTECLEGYELGVHSKKCHENVEDRYENCREGQIDENGLCLECISSHQMTFNGQVVLCSEPNIEQCH